MKLRGIISVLTVVISLLLIWGSFVNNWYLELQENRKCEVPDEGSTRPDCESPGCCPQMICPVDHYSFFIRSGVANMVGPKICFNNKIIMGGIMNDIGKGLNIVLVKGETGEIIKSNYFSVYSGGLLEFLKSIQTGNIVLIASYDDPSLGLTDEIREILAGLGSTMSHSVKKRDSWVFAGAAGIVRKSPFEKRTANDEKSNAYGDWPEMEEVGGCFPRKI